MTEISSFWQRRENAHVFMSAREDTLGRITRAISPAGAPIYRWVLFELGASGEGASGVASSLVTAKRHVERLVEAASASDAEQAFVYVLAMIGGRRTYVGWTTDVERRLAAHNSGRGARATRGRRWRLIHVETFPTRRLAMAREVELKRDRRLRRELTAERYSERGASTQ